MSPEMSEQFNWWAYPRSTAEKISSSAGRGTKHFASIHRRHWEKKRKEKKRKALGPSDLGANRSSAFFLPRILACAESFGILGACSFGEWEWIINHRRLDRGRKQPDRIQY